MRKTSLVLTVLATALLAVAAFAAETSGPQTLEGEYLWNRMEEPQSIKAVFTPKAEGEWDVAFYFNFRDEDHVYSGTASGSLTGGSLTGRVLSDGENHRPFKFEGRFVDGVFEGTHGTDDEEDIETGTLRLTRR